MDQNYTICEKPMSGSTSTTQWVPNAEPRVMPSGPSAMPEQLSYLRDQLVCMMEESSRLSNFVTGHGIPYDKLEDNSLIAHLAWVIRTVKALNETLHEINSALI